MVNRKEASKELSKQTSTNSSQRDISSGPEPKSARKLLTRSPQNDLSLAQRRLELAREDISRLNDALESAQGELEKNEQEFTKRLSSLKQERADLRQSLESKEEALQHSERECQHYAKKLEIRNAAIDELQQQLQLNQRELETKDGMLAAFENERKELLARLSEVPAGHCGENQEKPSSHSSVSHRFAFWKKTPTSIGLASAIGILILCVLGALFSWEPKMRVFSATPIEPLTTDTQEAVNQSGFVATEVSPDSREAHRPTDRRGGQASPATPDKPTKRVQDRLPQSGLAAPPLIALNPESFVMGSGSVLAADDAPPVHEVNVDEFLIGIYEVTFNEYDLFARATGRRLPNDFGWGRGTRPVVDVSWWDALAYVEWLSDQTGNRYRLPSEAEWEYAARAGRPTRYWWGYKLEAGRAVCFDCGTEWDNRSTAPVASLGPNQFGLYDTAGNAMEWVADCYYDSDKAAQSDARNRHRGGNCDFRVARGGAFNKPARSMRSDARHRFAANTRINMLGFRVVRDVER